MGDEGGGGKGGIPDAKVVGEAGDGSSGSPGDVAKIQGILAKVRLTLSDLLFVHSRVLTSRNFRRM